MPEQYQSALTGPQMDQALLDMANHTSERYAKGTANGAAVPSGTAGYHDNALYYKDLAANQAQAATNAADNANDAVAQAAAAAAQAANAAVRAESAIPAGSAAAVLFDRAQSLTNAQKAQARTNIGAGTGGGGGGGRNLLDNYWFTLGDVINQRGATTVSITTSEKYFIDRWICGASAGSASISINSSRMRIGVADNSSVYIYQKFLNPAPMNGKQITASVLLLDGTVISGTITRTNGTAQTIVTSGGVTLSFGTGNGFNITMTETTDLVAAKVEFGATSTIANDGPPDYPAELAKCQYYYERVLAPEGNMTMGTGSATATALFVSIKLTPKRVTPTMAVTGGLRAGSANLNINITNTPTWQAFDPGTGNGTLNFTQSGWTSGQFYRWGIVGLGYMEFFAEL